MNSLSIDVQAQIARLTLNRPSVANAIDQELTLALDQGLKWVEDPGNNVRSLVLTGSGTNFCSGIDLRSMRVRLSDDARCQSLMSRSFLDHIIEKLVGLRVPVIAAVNGVAAGAGMALALCADIILAADNAQFLPSFVKLGLVPDCGVTSLLSDRAGVSRARAALMLGNPIDAWTAEAWGIAHEVVPKEKLKSRAMELAAQLAAGPPSVLAATRRVLNYADTSHFRKQIEAERIAHREALKDREHLEGFTAFFEHREPKFRSQ